jgi:hypothetical protein
LQLADAIGKEKVPNGLFFSLFQATSQTLPDFYARSNFANTAKNHAFDKI